MSGDGSRMGCPRAMALDVGGLLEAEPAERPDHRGSSHAYLSAQGISHHLILILRRRPHVVSGKQTRSQILVSETYTFPFRCPWI